MTASASAAARKTLTIGRMATSPKTLHRKAMEKAAAAPAPAGEGLEELFPQTPASDAVANQPASDTPLAEPAPEPASADQPAAAPAVHIIESTAATAQAEELSASPSSPPIEDQPAQTAPSQPGALPSWSDADERAYQAMLARRKAAGFQRRGRDVSAQRVKPGAIAPNKGTVVADIVGLVAERGIIGRGDLLDLMATAAFAHPKGKGGDRAWSQGYVSGALANGFLTLAEEGGSALGEDSPEASGRAA